MERLVLIAKIGWMKRYRGPSEDDLGPLGAGTCDTRYKKEAWNFLRRGKWYYGFCRPTGLTTHPKIKLERIKPGENGDELAGVLVIFVAPFEGNGPLRVVGWYRNATVYRDRRLIGKGRPYYLTTRNATLLKEGQRVWTAKRRSGGVGQSMLCYLLDEDGRSKGMKWILPIIQHIEKYGRARTT